MRAWMRASTLVPRGAGLCSARPAVCACRALSSEVEPAEHPKPHNLVQVPKNSGSLNLEPNTLTHSSQKSGAPNVGL